MNFAGFVDTLWIMGNGMVGGMVAMGLICLFLMGLYALSNRTNKKKGNDSPSA